MRRDCPERNLKYYPVSLNLCAKKVLVVGAGKVGERKIKTLLEAEARVSVTAPWATPFVRRLARRGKIAWHQKTYAPADLRGAVLVIAATADRALNRRISRDAQRKNLLMNAVDQPDLSTFISPAVFRKRGTVVAVSTDAKNPPLSRDLKNFLKSRWREFSAYRKKAGV